MRKYIKSIREQFDNNSVMFKQAKRVFHYEPKTTTNRHYGVLKQYRSKKDSASQFKDDYSSVKDLKNENNQINQSSWIAKLVNGLQDSSISENKHQDKESKQRYSSVSEARDKQEKKQCFGSVQSENVVIIADDEKTPLSNITNCPLPITEHTTKKNSYSFVKKPQSQVDKNSKIRQIDENFSEVRETKEKKGKRKINGSQSCVSKSENHLKKGVFARKKSWQNLHSNSKSKSKSKTSMHEGSSLSKAKVKQLKTETNKKKKFRYQFQKEQVKVHEQSLTQMDEIKCVTDNKVEDYQQPPFTEQNGYSPLFDQSQSQKEKNMNEIVRTRNGCGSIRKNKKGIDDESYKGKHQRQESTQLVISPKFSSNSKYLNEAVSQIPVNENVITSSEEKILVDKYLRGDLISKIQNKYGRDTTKGTVSSSLLPSRKQTKRYHYQLCDQQSFNLKIEAIHDERTDLFEKKHHYQSHTQYLPDKENKLSNFQSKNKISVENSKQSSYLAYKNRYNKEILEQENKISTLNRNLEKVEVSKHPLKSESVPLNNHFGSQDLTEDPKKIDKNAYLQSQIDSLVIEPSFMNSFQNTSKKEQFGTIKRKQNKGEAPTKYSYIAFNSASKENSYEKKSQVRERSIENVGLEGSQILIDRLNQKLSFYIKEHKLRDEEEEPSDWREGEGTHRQMHMNFNELKKHCEFLKK